MWVGTPFATIIYLGGMKSIPVGVYESARIEGANVRQLVRFITIPLLKPFTHLLIVMKMIYTFKIFRFIYAITGEIRQDLQMLFL
ncbi:carbohydrate ABC transporter permease [Mesotoga sp.]|uniref:carbohydrate ABC transporter permease n=1 Tax=Mesotoga sp. TaxID=2053577 RepID=UPI00345EF999